MSIRNHIRRTFPLIRSRLLQGVCCGAVLASLSTGCTALHPIRGVPASYLPEQFEGPSRDNKRTIDLSLLVRTPPDQYRVSAGDVLSVYIPRVLGSQSTEVNSVGIEPPINMPASIEDPPTVGYPITVRDDNTIPLPQIPPLPVGGMTLHEVEMAIRKAYSQTHHILNPDEAMVLVSLQRPRIHRVLVVRQEANTTLTTSSQPGSVNIGTTGKGTARVVTLKAYENDVLHALAQGDGVDGLPGLNAKNVIYIIRRRPRGMTSLNCPPGLPGQAYPALPPVDPMPMMPTAPPGPAGMPPLMPMGATSATPNRSGHSIVPVSYEQPAAMPQPFQGYRSRGEVGGHSLAAPANPIAGHSTAGVVTPPQYNASLTGASQNVTPTQYQYTTPAPVLPTPAPVGMEGHSWGVVNPQPVPDPAGQSGMDALGWTAMLDNFDPTIDNPNIIRIPVRLGPGEQPHITEELITLNDGDIVFIDSRETEVFYTAGLLGGGQYMLPRDYDLGVLEAVSIAEGRSNGAGGSATRSIGGVSALNHDVSFSASRLAILRTLPNGKRITIEVDLNKAMRYQQENIRIQPGDILFLEYTFCESVAAFTQRYLLEGALFSLAASQFNSNR